MRALSRCSGSFTELGVKDLLEVDFLDKKLVHLRRRAFGPLGFSSVGASAPRL